MKAEALAQRLLRSSEALPLPDEASPATLCARAFILAICAAIAMVGASCGSTPPGSQPNGDPAATSAGSPGSAPPPCPVGVIRVVVTARQWSNVVEQLAGGCAEVTAIVSGTGDPHDFEPSPADTAKFGKAQLVVMNGLGYDEWAKKAVDVTSSKPAVVNGGSVVGLRDGDNPHLWYGPRYVSDISRAVTNALARALPEASKYFDERAVAFTESMKPYEDLIASMRPITSEVPYGATESVFGYLGDALGMRDATPEGYRRAAANESDPSPGDIAEFQRSLTGGQMSVLIFNSQTSGPVPEQLESDARDAAVPVVSFTEAPPEGTAFVDWQVSQLQALKQALQSPR